VEVKKGEQEVESGRVTKERKDVRVTTQGLTSTPPVVVDAALSVESKMLTTEYVVRSNRDTTASCIGHRRTICHVLYVT